MGPWENSYIRQPLWWGPAISHYRRLTWGQRAVLDAVVFDLWRWTRPSFATTAEISIPDLSARTGVSVRHVGRSIRALAADPGELVEANPPILGHGILLAVDRADTRIRVVQLRPWRDWRWRSPETPARVQGAIQRALDAMQGPTPGERLALILLDHLAWFGRLDGTEPAPLVGSAGLTAWAKVLDQLHARRWTAADLRAVLSYVETDADWWPKIRGAGAALELFHAWEGLLLRSRRRRG